MKRLRDILIIVVLGGLVAGYASRFISHLHQASVQMRETVVEAEMACAADGMICHPGYDSFQSEEAAEAYLKSPEHLAAVKARSDRKAQEELDSRYTDCLIHANGRKQFADCEKLRAKTAAQ